MRIKLVKNNCDNSLYSSSPASAKKYTDPAMGGSNLLWALGKKQGASVDTGKALCIMSHLLPG